MYIVLTLLVVACAIVVVVILACYDTQEGTRELTWFERDQASAKRWSLSEPLTE